MDDVCLIHHDLTTLQEKMDITNHVAKKYHIEFGAAKCKVMRIGPGQESKITLNDTILEVVPKYKYLGKNIQHKRQPWRTPERPRNQNNGSHPKNTSRNRGQIIQRDENESYLAMHRGHHHPNLNIWIRSMEPNKKGRRPDTKDIQHNPENDHEPTPGNTYNNTTEGIRIHTNQSWNKYKKNNASQKDWRKRRKLPNKR